jgi:hypothetical protein
MIKEAIQELLDRGSKTVTVHEVGDKAYSNHELHQIKPDLVDKLPVVAPLEVGTLSAVVDYLLRADESRDGMATGPLLVHVVNYCAVRVTTQAFGPRRQRERLLEANYNGGSFPYCSYLEQEEAMIKIQTAFATEIMEAEGEPDNRQRLLDFIGRLVSINSVEGTDTGAAQSVVVKKGVNSFAKEGATVPNPITLRPYVTFAEIPQPAIEYVVRIKESGTGVPRIALFETDGHRWIHETIEHIRAFLEIKLGDANVIILA